MPMIRRAAVAAILLVPSLACRAGTVAAPPVERCPAAASSERVFSLSLAGNRAGFQTECRMRDGTREYVFVFNDRGRGPALRERMVLGPAGLPVRIDIEGHDYLKTPIAETFRLEDGRAAWKNKVEAGEQRSDAAAFYLSQSGVYAEIGLLAAALLRAPGHRLPLLPLGEARLEELAVRSVQTGGRAREVRLFAISGLGFQPVAVWLDDESELFAAVDEWVQLVPEGWESVAGELLEVQEARLAAVRRAQAARLRRTPAGPIAIVNAVVFDSQTASMHPESTVVIEGDTIRAVGLGGGIPIPAHAERIDAQGRALLPGLWDMHGHPQPQDGLLLLAGGVTGVRDMAAEPDKVARLRSWENGEALGPRVAYAGILDGPGPFQGPTSVLVDTEAEARAAVAAMDEAGFALVKVYSSVKPELVPAIVAEAKTRGLRVGGHVPAFMTAEEAVRAGFDEIQHMNMLFLNFLFDDVPDTRTPARLTAVAERAAELDFSAEATRSFVELLASRQVTVDPTLQLFENLLLDRPGRVARAYAEVADRLPPVVRRGLMEGGLPVPEGKEEKYADSFRAMKRMLLALHEAGVPLVAGTDSLGGLALVRELEIYAESGIPAPVVLQMATRDAARAAGLGERLGSIEPGMLADLILVDGDPSRRLGDLRRLRMIILDGEPLDPVAIWDELGIRPIEP